MSLIKKRSRQFYILADGDILTCGLTFGYICDKWSKNHSFFSSLNWLNKKVFDIYPHIYNNSKKYLTNFEVGNIYPHVTPRSGIPTIIELCAQRFGGGAKWGFGETKSKRLKWFKNCLVKLDVYLRENHIRKFALPYMIGCENESEKKDWHKYKNAINDFALTGLVGEDPFVVYLIRPKKTV